jgi:hypothetical protein
MEFLVWFGAPFVVAAALAGVLARSWVRFFLLLALGAVIGAGLFLAAYAAAPTEYDGCSDCELFWSRWWEPAFVGVLVGVGYFFWLFGVAVGSFANLLWRTPQDGHADPRQP